MLVFITPKLFDIKGKREKRVPYSYRSRATIPSANIEDSRTTHDINTVKPNDIVVLGKKHSKNDCDYLIENKIKFIIDVADDKFAMFKHWYYTIPKANAVVTTCHKLREVISEETGCKAFVIPDPTERKRGTPKFEVKDVMKAVYYGADANYAKVDFIKVMKTLNEIHPTKIKIMTNRPDHAPAHNKMLRRYGGYWLNPQDRLRIIQEGMEQYKNLIQWDMDLQGELVEKSDFVLLPVVGDRESQCKGNNRPVDALQQGRMVLTNPGIPSYKDDLDKLIYCGDIYEQYQEMIKQPNQVITRIKNAQRFIDGNYTPTIIGRKWEQVYENISRNHI